MPSAAEFAGIKIYGRFMTLSYRDMLELMVKCPDFYRITDAKYVDHEVVSEPFRQMYNHELCDVVNSLYPFKEHILTLNNLYDEPPTLDQFRENAAFCAEGGSA